jgi:Ca2+-binding RTX toxin-like protein
MAAKPRVDRSAARFAIALSVLALSGLAAAPADAAYVTFTTNPSGGSTVWFQDFTGEVNTVTAAQAGGSVTLADSTSTLIDNDGFGGCEVRGSVATCPVPASNPMFGGNPLTILAGPGNDTVTLDSSLTVAVGADGAEGADTLNGGPNADSLAGGPEADIINAGAGNDSASGDGAFYPIPGGGDGNDVVSGGDGDDVLDGNGGDDIIDGGAGDDQLNGGIFFAFTAADGNDTLNGGPGNDNAMGGGGNDTIDGGPGDDAGGGLFQFCGALDGGTGNDSVSGGDGADVVNGGAGNDTTSGGAGDDLVDGDDGVDTVNGGPGDDELLQDDGLEVVPLFGTELPAVDGDTFNGDEGNDTVRYDDRTSPVTVTANDSAANDGIAGEQDNVGTTVENILGGSAGDNLTGNDSANELFGNGGTDGLAGLGGGDGLFGGTGNDTITGGAGHDELRGERGDDVFSSNDSTSDQVGCGAGDDSVTNDAIDTIDGDCEAVSADPVAGPAAAPGARGPTGPTGERGRSARLIVSCRLVGTKKKTLRCSTSSPTSASGTPVRIRLSRKGRLVASGRARLRGGQGVVDLRLRRSLRAGAYRLSARLPTGDGGTETLTQRFMVR